MLNLLRRLARRVRLGSLERGDFSGASERPIENVDAGTAAQHRDDEPFPGGTFYPPGYVKPHDEGRPRK